MGTKAAKDHHRGRRMSLIRLSRITSVQKIFRCTGTWSHAPEANHKGHEGEEGQNQFPPFENREGWGTPHVGVLTGARGGCYNRDTAVGVAQLAEHRTVAPDVVGSIPISHPNSHPTSGLHHAVPTDFFYPAPAEDDHE